MMEDIKNTKDDIFDEGLENSTGGSGETDRERRIRELAKCNRPILPRRLRTDRSMPPLPGE